MTNLPKDPGFSPTLLSAVREHPDDFTAWDELESAAASEQAPEPVAELYAEVLVRDFPLATAKRIGERALRFCEEWFADETPLMQQVLLRVFDLDPSDESVFDRLTMGLTATGSWERLLAIYERAVDASDSVERQIQLLEDAVRVAKDLAADSDRAILFMTRLVPLRPHDHTLRSALERLLERGERFRELIALWDSGIQGLSAADEVAKVQVQIATCWLSRLKNAPAAVEVLQKVLEANPADRDALALADLVLGSEDEAPGTRRDALNILRAAFTRENKPIEVARALRASVTFAQGDEREALYREAAGLWLANDVGDEALTDLGELFVLLPEDLELEAEVSALASRLSAQARSLALYERAAVSAKSSRRACELYLRAATLAHHPVGQVDKAIALCERVFVQDTEADLALDAGRALDALLEAQNLHAARLPVLERLSALESDVERKREVRGALARLAHAQGQNARAIATWKTRLEDDVADREALDGLVLLHEQGNDFRALVESLRLRAALREGEGRARDLAKIAQIYAESLGEIEAALSAWSEVHRVAPELLTSLDVRSLLDTAAQAEGERTSRVLSFLGDAYRILFADAERALAYYTRALASDVATDTAQAGLIELLEVEAVRARAAEALAGVFASSKNFDGLLFLLPHRLSGAEDASVRASLLRQAGKISEQQKAEPAQAFAHLCAALKEEPKSQASDADLQRLAEQLPDWEALADVVHAAFENPEIEGARKAFLAKLEGQIAERSLGDGGRALVAYAQALKAAPDDADSARSVVRVAAQQGEFSLAYGVVLASAQRADQVPDELLAQLESEVSSAEAYARLASFAETGIETSRLNPQVKRALLIRAAEWREKQCADEVAAEILLQKAYKLGAPHAETLQRLILIQRKAKGEPLCESLLALAQLSEHELDALLEAEELAREHLTDPQLERRVLGITLRRCAMCLLQGVREMSGHALEPQVVRTASRLAELLHQASDHRAELVVLREAAQLPLEPQNARELAERAARVASEQLADAQLAASLYQRALEHAPEATELLAALADQYEKLGRLEELLVLRRKELSLVTSVDRRLELRLDVARVMAELETRGGRLGALRDNLQEAPGHVASLAALERALRERGALEDVHALFASQAAQLEGLGDVPRAAELWAATARLSDSELHDEDKALFAYQRVCSLAESDDALEAMARIRAERGEYAQAIPWLSRRLERLSGEARVTGRLRLARAYEHAGELGRAIEGLEQGLSEAPQAFEMRELLVKLYRETAREADLARVLAESALETSDRVQGLRYAREAAELFCGPLKKPEQAVSVLSRAVDIDPEDRALKCLFADALIAAERLVEAQDVLDGMIQAFGRRRSVERAEVHMRLAKVAQASGKLDEALTQLDTASSMDRAHTGILRALGELAHQAGQLDRAERAYRALLMALKKPQGEAESSVGVASVLYELYRIATQLNQTEKAGELLENAVQTAVHSEAETAQLKQILVHSGDSALLLRVLELRLAQVTDSAAEAAARSDLADVLELSLDRKAQALDERLRALACAPERDVLHRKALSLAESQGLIERYSDALRSLYERARRKEDLALGNDLALRAGAVFENSLSNLADAAAQYRLVQSGAQGYVEAQFALARVAGKLGRADEEREVLAQIAELPDDPAFAAGKREATYRVAELAIADEKTRESGLRSLEKLLKDSPDYARAGAILRELCERVPDDARALGVLEHIARRSDDPSLLLHFLERHAQGAEPSLTRVREGAELAQRSGQVERAEAFMRRAIQVAEQGDGIIDALWAAVSLGRLRAQVGDVEGAVDWLERAMHATDSYEGFELGLEAGKLAEERGKDSARAIRIYEALREREPGDRRVWSALLGLYQQKGELERAQQLVSATLSSLVDPSERNALRVEIARFLFENGHEDDGARFLHDVLDEDPDHEEAALRLADLYERRGENEAMAELLSRKLESARERRSPSLIPLSLRMGSLLEATRPEMAASVYREGLQLLPESFELMRATLSLLDPESEAMERAALLERYLLGDGRNDENALDAAVWLLEYHTQGGDEAAFERALAIAYHVAPGHAEIRSRLEQWYRQRGDFGNLAQLLESEAERAQADDKTRALDLIREAADIRLHQMGQASEAAALLRRARAWMPEDFELLKRAVLASAAAGDHQLALSEVDSALGESSRRKAQRIELLLLRADVALAAGLHDDAVAGLDTANQLSGGSLLTQLLEGIEHARLGAQARGDEARERELTLRLVSSLSQSGATEQAAELLSGWAGRFPSDVEALRILLSLQANAERWLDAVAVAELLLREDQPELLGAIGERLLAAARSLQRSNLARAGLEGALERAPGQVRLVELLGELYAELGENLALAELMLKHLSASDSPERRFDQLRRVGQLLLDAGDSERALWALTQASALRPDDVATVLFIADAQILAHRFQEAQDLLEKAMNACKQRRSPELCQLRHRMARLSAAAGDPQARLEWLNSALDADMNNGEVASELAVVAQHMGDLDTALKALRAITMLKSDAPMTRAEAFYRQAVIVAQKGEPRRAVLWAKKAKAENANFPGVDALLAELGDAS